MDSSSEKVLPVMLLPWFLKHFFDSLYHEFAWSYDLIARIVSGGRWKDWVRSAIPLIQGKVIMELGIGTGTLQLELAGPGRFVVGVDESRQMLRIAIKKLREKSHPVNIMRARSESLPFPSLSFDSVVATFPSEYIFLPQTLRSCRRVLRQGGHLVILLGVEVGGKGVKGKFLRLLYRITGQSTPSEQNLAKLLDHLMTYGFCAHFHRVKYKEDSLTFLIAE